MSGVRPHGAGSGKRSLATRSAARTSSRPESIFSARAHHLVGRGGLRRLGAELGRLQLQDAGLLLDVDAFLLAALLVRGALPLVVLPAHVVDVDHLAVRVQVEDLVHGLLHELHVVADHDQSALEVLEELAQPDHRVGVEVVGRLVEEHRLGAGEQDPGELDAAALAAGEGRQRLVEDAVGQAQVARDRRGLGLGRVAAECGEAILQVSVGLHRRAAHLGIVGLAISMAAFSMPSRSWPSPRASKMRVRARSSGFPERGSWGR